jgi:hypothetical protein
MAPAISEGSAATGHLAWIMPNTAAVFESTLTVTSVPPIASNEGGTNDA